jgi:hypothetical protein
MSSHENTSFKQVAKSSQIISTKPRINSPRVLKKRSQKKYHLPVIGHFADTSIEFNSILEAEAVTGINYTLIFEACIGKIFKAKNVIWEYKKGNHYIKYKAYYINVQESYTRKSGFNG